MAPPDRKHTEDDAATLVRTPGSDASHPASTMDTLVATQPPSTPSLRGPRACSDPDEPPRLIAADRSEGGLTLPRSVVIDQPMRGEGQFSERYTIRKTLGVGGMGEVHLCQDSVIGRDVALKVLRSDIASTDESSERFLREARVQGQLEHPSVVPVYDLGVTPEGALYFTMKRVRGITLEDALDAIASGDPQARERFTRRRLLSAFSQLCLAIDFAHARGVLHRDLKPANVMLGDHGEVHVLDWGIAKVLSAPSEPRAAPSGGRPPNQRARSDAQDAPLSITHTAPSQATVAGSLMGTPGYMSPEQARGEIDCLDARSDVYALGAILYEILSGQRLHQGRTLMEMIALNTTEVAGRPSVRAPDADIAPELDALCEHALALDPAHRLSSARALSDAIERYLDGDRDAEKRRAIADECAQRAKTLADDAVRTIGPAALEARALALRTVARALAFDPSNAVARSTLARLLTEPPREVPPEAAEALAAAAVESQSSALRIAALRYATWLVVTPLLLWMGVRNWLAAGTVIALVLATSALAFALAQRKLVGGAAVLALLALSSVAVASMSVFVSPFVVVPALVATNGMLFALYGDRSQRKVVLAANVLTVCTPVALELLGVLPRSFIFREDALVLVPRAVNLPPTATLAFLLASSVAMVLTPIVAVGRIRDQLSNAERRLFLQAWQLRQAVPDESRREDSSR